MKTKKIISLVLALVLCMALALPASAATAKNDAKSLTQNIEVSGKAETPTISLTLANTGKVVVNPYMLSVNVGTTNDPEYDESQIFSAPTTITNKSDIDLAVAVTVTGTVGGNAKFAASSALTDTKNNSVFLNLYAVQATDEDEDVPSVAKNKVANVSAKATTVKYNKEAEDGTKNLYLNATGKDSNGAAIPNYLIFAFDGNAAATPPTPWAATDTVSVALAFSFTPTVNKGPSVTTSSLTEDVVTAYGNGADAEAFTFSIPVNLGFGEKAAKELKVFEDKDSTWSAGATNNFTFELNSDGTAIDVEIKADTVKLLDTDTTKTFNIKFDDAVTQAQAIEVEVKFVNSGIS